MITELIKMMTENGISGYFTVFFTLISLMMIVWVFIAVTCAIVRMAIEDGIRQFFVMRAEYLDILGRYIKEATEKEDK